VIGKPGRRRVQLSRAGEGGGRRAREGASMGRSREMGPWNALWSTDEGADTGLVVGAPLEGCCRIVRLLHVVPDRAPELRSHGSTCGRLGRDPSTVSLLGQQQAKTPSGAKRSWYATCLSWSTLSGCFVTSPQWGGRMSREQPTQAYLTSGAHPLARRHGANQISRVFSISEVWHFGSLETRLWAGRWLCKSLWKS